MPRGIAIVHSSRSEDEPGCSGPTGSALGPFSSTCEDITMSVVPNSNGPNPRVDLTPLAEVPSCAASLEVQTAVTNRPGILRSSIYVVLATLVAGFVAWGLGEKTFDYYRPSAKGRDPRDFSALNRAKRIADQKNTAIAFAAFGAILGMLSGATGGALRGSIPGGATAALAGLLLGGIGGALVSYQVAPIFAQFYSDETPSLLLPFLVRGAIWGVVGMAAGLALGWGWRGLPGIPGMLLGGMVGGVGGTVAFEVLNALLFPADRNDAVIPSSTQSRLLAYVFVSVGVAIGAILFGRQRSRPASRTSQVQS